MKYFLFSVIALLVSACVDIPDREVQRPSYDDIRDTDRDGVINQRDHCAATPPGAVIDNEGCSQWHRGTEKEIFTIDFDFDSSELRADQQSVIDHLVGVLEQYPDVTVELIGDTSPEGSREYNQALAQRRVAAIEANLKLNGVSDERINPHIYSDRDSVVEKEIHSRQRRTKAVLHHPGKRITDRSWSIYGAEQQTQGAK
ncbi:OmpA family protein [Oceanicoccus sagamiensis]|uniref:OmpA-like domain-containing protein n=1 Tax=Oceanicoccus sagamiensis TaxID=716816 RepID=A0A1X9NI09_9GAMM|nr:OmpA family protein [Oceanicoccus sagamiensis]ARN75149.1 hypothetical protein BST96_14110 [Oceanicoccus sagamiensis]